MPLALAHRSPRQHAWLPARLLRLLCRTDKQTGNLCSYKGENLHPCRRSSSKYVEFNQDMAMSERREGYLGTYLPAYVFFPHPEEESPDFEPQPEEGLADF